MAVRAVGDPLRALSLYALAALFVCAAGAHFVFADAFAAIVPAPLPFKREIVLLTGAIEAALALALLVPRWRSAAGWGLAAYCVAVLPANVQMALDGASFGGVAVPGWALWLRVALQLPLIALILWAAGSIGAVHHRR